MRAIVLCTFAVLASGCLGRTPLDDGTTEANGAVGGSNEYGQLGNGTLTNSDKPVTVSTLKVSWHGHANSEIACASSAIHQN